MPVRADVPLVTGVFRASEKAVLAGVADAGVENGRILYVCAPSIVAEMSEQLGVTTTDVAGLRAADLTRYDVVFVGDMFLADREVALELVEPFRGAVFRSVLELPPRRTIPGMRSSAMREAVRAGNPDPEYCLLPLDGRMARLRDAVSLVMVEDRVQDALATRHVLASRPDLRERLGLADRILGDGANVHRIMAAALRRSDDPDIGKDMADAVHGRRTEMEAVSARPGGPPG